VPAESIAFSTVTLESDKYVCVRDISHEEKYIFIVDLVNPSHTMRTKITAESAIMNPSQNIIALRSSPTPKQSLQIFDMTTKSKLHDIAMTEVVEFWKWITDSTLGLVTATSVYHWTLPGKPKKVFERLENLTGTQIINYVVDSTEKWCVLIGIGKKEERIAGSSQLYSVEKKSITSN